MPPTVWGRLHLVGAFGIKLGKQLRELMTANTKLNDDKGTIAASWVNVTCESVGTSDSSCKPPPDAVEAVRRLLIEATGMTEADANTPRLTNVDAYLLDAWRIAACDPEVFVGAWLKRRSTGRHHHAHTRLRHLPRMRPPGRFATGKPSVLRASLQDVSDRESVE